MKRIVIGMVALAILVMCYVAMADGPLGLILNGDFSSAATIVWDNGYEGYMHWRPEIYQTHLDLDKDGSWDKMYDLPSPNVRSQVKYSNRKDIAEGAPVQYVEFKVVGSGHHGAGIKLRYIPFVGVYGDGVNPEKPTSWRNVDGLQLVLPPDASSPLDPSKYYYLEADVYIEHHNLKDSGWYAGDEWPIQIRLGLADANNRGKQHNWGFLDRDDTQGLNPYTKIPKKTWYHFRSHELRSLWETRPGKPAAAYPLRRVHNLSVQAKGWELKSRVANICIVEYTTPQSSSPDDQTYMP